MKNARPRRNACRPGWACALASWPLIAISACSVYESSLLADAAAPRGGAGADAGMGPVTTAGTGEEGRRNGYWYVGGDLAAGATLEPPASKFEMTQLIGDRSTTVAHVKATASRTGAR